MADSNKGCMRLSVAALVAAGLLIIGAGPPAQAADYYIDPNGSYGAAGTIGDPWDIYKLDDAGAVSPGDTVWLRGGTYYYPIRDDGYKGFLFDLRGTEANPITIRNYDGEHAIIDGGLASTGRNPQHVKVWGMEIMVSEFLDPNDDRYSTWGTPGTPSAGQNPSWPEDMDRPYGGMELGGGTGIHVINMFIHDSMKGFGWWDSLGHESSIHGTIIWRNGWFGYDRPHGHGIYAQNASGSMRYLTESIIMDSLGSVMEMYGSSAASVSNFTYTGNICRPNMDPQYGQKVCNVAANLTADNHFFDDNVLYGCWVWLGYDGGAYHVECTNNTIIRGSIRPWGYFTNLVTTGNVIWVDSHWNPDDPNYIYTPDWEWTDPPIVDLRVNDYESDRANLCIIQPVPDFDANDAVAVDFSSFLGSGQSFEVYSARDPFGDPIYSGTYTGSSIDIPIIEDPMGWTDTEFAAYIVKMVGNAAPAVDAGADATVNWADANSVSLDAAVTDDGNPEGETVTQTWSKDSGPGTVTFANANNVDTTATFSTSGEYVLKLTAEDTERTTTDTVTIWVNVAPSVDAGSDDTITMPDAEAVLNATVSDDGLPGDGALTTTWSQDSGPGTVTFVDSSAVDTVAAFDTAGTYVLLLSAADGAATTTDTVQITVTPQVNAAPVVNAGADVNIEYPGENTVSLDGTVADDGLPVDYTVTQTWSKVSGDGDVTFTNSSAVDTVATFSTSGTYVLQLAAEDSEYTTTDTVTVGVKANEAPAVSAGPDAVGGVYIPLDGTVTDDGLPSAGSLTMTWSGADSFDDAYKEDPIAYFSTYGTYTLTLTATDDALTTSDTVTVVSGANAAPTVEAGTNQTIEFAIGTASLDGTVSDDGIPDNESVTTTWSKTSGPGTVSFTDAYAVDTTATFSDAGTYVLNLRADDGEHVTNDTVQIIAKANVPPTVVAGVDSPLEWEVATSISLDATVTDDGYPSSGSVTVTWSKDAGPGTVTFADEYAVDTTATFSTTGTYALLLTAYDDDLEDSDLVVITVKSNSAPSVNAGADSAISVPDDDITLNATVSDDGLPSAGSLTVTWSKDSGPGDVTFTDANVVDTEATFSTTGTYVLMLTAEDGEETTTDTVTIVYGENLELYLKLDDASGVTATDSSGNARHGALAGATWTTGKIDGGINFDEDNDRVIVDDFSMTSEFTLAFWFKMDDNTGDSYQYIFSWGWMEGFNQDNIHIWIGEASSGAPGHIISYVLDVNDTGAPGALTVIDPNGFVDGNWHHYCMTVSAADGVEVFLDGSRRVQEVTKGGDSINPETDLNIGRRADGVASRHFGGDLDEFRIYNRALSDEEVADLASYTAGENGAPTVYAGDDDQITWPDQDYQLDGIVIDDGLPVEGALTQTWSKDSGPGDVTFSNANAEDPIATFSTLGTYVLQLLAEDGELTTTDTVQIEVVENQPPTANANGDQTITWPEQIVTLAGSVTDDGHPIGNTVTHTWSKDSGAGTVTFADENDLDTTATFSTAGTYVLLLTADDGVLTDTDTVTITVNEATNQAPIVDAGTPQTIELPDEDADLDATVNDDGLPSGTLSYTWSKESGPGDVTFGDVNVLDTTAQFSAAGVYELKLTVEDTALTTTDLVEITVVQNVAPTVDAGSDQTIEWPDDDVDLDGDVADDGYPSAGALTQTWSKDSGPGDVTFGNANAVDTTADFSTYGTYVLQLLAEDGSLTTTDTMTVTINQNNSPTVDAGANQETETTTASLDGTVNDDGLPDPPAAVTTTWSKVSGAGDVTFTDANAVDTTATFSTADVYVLQLLADDSAATTTDTVQITVIENAAPTVGAGVDQQIAWPDDDVDLDGTVADDGYPSAGSLTQTWSKDSGPGDVTFGDANVVDTTAEFSTTGTYVLKLAAYDDALSTTDTMQVIVKANEAPTVDAGTDDATAWPDADVDLDGTVSDDGLGGTLTTTWTKDSGDGDVTFGDAGAVDTTAAFSTVGTYVLKLTATDTALTTTDTVTIEVMDALYLFLKFDETSGTTAADSSGNSRDAVVTGATWITGNLGGAIDFDASTENAVVSDFAADTDFTLAFWFKPTDNTGNYFQFMFNWATNGDISGISVMLAEDNNARANKLLTAMKDTGDSEDWDALAVDDPNNYLDGGWHHYCLTVSSANGSNVYVDGTLEASDPNRGNGTVNPTGNIFIGGKYTEEACYMYGGGVDDLRLYSRELTAGEVSELAQENAAPTVDAGSNQSLEWGSPPNTASLDGTVSDDDMPAAGSLTQTWSKDSGPGTVTFTDASAVDTTATFSTVGTYVLQLLAEDGEKTTTDTVTITLAGNAGPTVDAGADAAVAWPLNTTSLDGAVSDDGLPLEGALTVTWSKDSGPGTVTFANPNGVDTMATFSTTGLYLLKLTATDSALTAGDTVTISVNEENELLLWLTLDDASGTVAADSSGNDRDGTVHNATWASGQIDGALSFDDNGDYVSVGDFALTADFSVAMWFKSTDNSGTTFDFLFSWGQMQNLSNVNVVLIEDSGYKGGYLRTCIQDSTDEYDLTALDINDPNNYLDGGWHHYALTVSAANGSRVYVDGTLEASDPLQGGDAINPAANILLGGYYNQAAYRWLNGLLDDVRIYGRELSAAEVTALAEQNLPPSVYAGADDSIVWPDANSMSLNATVSDDGLPSGTVTMTWSKVSGDGDVTFSDANVEDPTATFSTKGTYVLKLTAADTELTASDTVTITLTGNVAPDVDAGSNASVGWPTDTVSLDGTVTDDGAPAGGSVTVTWSKESGTGTVTFTNANAVDTAATFSTTGTYVLKLTAEDTELTATDTVTITVAEEAMLLHLKLDESSGTVAADSSGNGNDGTVTGATWATGHISGGISFDESGDYVIVPDFDLSGSDVTVAFWFKSSDNSGTVWDFMFNWGKTQGYNTISILFTEDSAAYSKRLRTIVKDTNDAEPTLANLDVIDPNNLLDGNWHHYAVTIESGFGTKVYVDGSLEATDSNQGGDTMNPAKDIYLGGREDLAGYTMFNGLLDDVRVYDEALTAGEIEDLASQ